MIDDEPIRLNDEQVYVKYADELMRFATGLVGPADAEDVLADAVARCLRTRGWSEVANQRAYLYRAVLNEAHSLGRRRARRRVYPIEELTTAEPLVAPEVRAAVDRLSVRQRAVVLLTYWADLDPATVADRLGISEGSVRRHLARARARLREVLDA